MTDISVTSTRIDKSMGEKLEDALDAIRANQLNLAHHLLLEALKTEPENTQILLLLGWTAPTSASAEFYYHHILEHHPDNPLAIELSRNLSHKSRGNSDSFKRNSNETKKLVARVIAYLERPPAAGKTGGEISKPTEEKLNVEGQALIGDYDEIKKTGWLSIPSNISAAMGYLAALALAETLTTLAKPQYGLVLHGLILVALTLHAALFSQRSQQRFLITLTLAPLIRLMSLSMPLLDFPPIYWYAVIGLPLLLAAFLVLRVTGFKANLIGLNGRALPWQLLVGVCGFVFGYLEYIILRPQPLINSFSWQKIWIPALILLIFTGFLEEIIFRGLIQRGAAGTLGRYSLVYVSALFAILHLGYRSIWDLIFVFLVAMFFGWVVMRTGSLLGVTLSHGLTNIALYLLIPFLMNPTSSPVAVNSQIEMSTSTLSSAWIVPEEITVGNTPVKSENGGDSWISPYPTEANSYYIDWWDSEGDDQHPTINAYGCPSRPGFASCRVQSNKQHEFTRDGKLNGEFNKHEISVE